MSLSKQLVLISLTASAIVGTLSNSVFAETCITSNQLANPEIIQYLHTSWQSLTRNSIDASSISDSKTDEKKHYLYVSASEDIEQLKQHATDTSLIIQPLPKNVVDIKAHGLLYLPNPYVVPGGRFNEMYGWDSYFIVLGLLESKQYKLALGMLENFYYEIDHYGTVLNANRTYYLQRSQPPLLSAMVMAIYNSLSDPAILSKALPYLIKTHQYWTQGPHAITKGGLSRYYAFGQGPADEVLASEKNELGQSHYDRIRDYIKANPSPQFARYYSTKHDQLTPLFFKADRTMRESGFDPSNRFGPFNMDILDYWPVCLNSFLYKTEIDIARIYSLENKPEQATLWQQKAEHRKALINKYMWNENKGLYFDYNTHSQSQSDYVFATTFIPMWAGISTQRQAEQIRQHMGQLESTGGIVTSTTQSGNQWDYPFGWAPLQYFTTEGLSNYGFHQDAQRIRCKFMTLIKNQFDEYPAIFEKYDVVHATRHTRKNINYGYSSNEIGFGWTNGVYLKYLNPYKN